MRQPGREVKFALRAMRERRRMQTRRIRMQNLVLARPDHQRRQTAEVGEQRQSERSHKVSETNSISLGIAKRRTQRPRRAFSNDVDRK